MISGRFYYISDEYYEKFSNCNLMGNKDADENGEHGRPCFYCFEHEKYFWMIPISSQIDKFTDLYNEKMIRYNGNYDGIRFGYVNGELRAFLIQNLCPVSSKYIESEYRVNKQTVPVTINENLSRELNGIVRKVLRFHKKGIRLTLTKLDIILNELNKEREISSI